MKPTGIVMTDLAIGGYKMGKRTKGLDITHSTLLMDKIAHMHAASIVMELKVKVLNKLLFNQKHQSV